MSEGLSAYDNAVPHPAPDPRLAEAFRELRALRQPARLGALREVVLVVGSSRSGSSMLAELLRQHPELLSVPGEVNPYVTVAQLSDGTAATFMAELARDVGSPAPTCSDPERATADVAWRLRAQFPQAEWTLRQIGAAVRAALDGAGPQDSRVYTRAVLRQLPGAAACEASYDLGARSAGSAEPTEPVVEMAPYIAFRGWRGASPDELASRPLVLATPRNSYRLDWLAAQFPAARIRVLHLTRNPAAAVNGLVDGWHHRGFFTCHVPLSLGIAGYSERYPWGRRWWKYDVPPAWTELRQSNLSVVAAEQWRSAHAAVREFHGRSGLPTMQVRYEDLITAGKQVGVAERIAGFLGIDPAPLARSLRAPLDPVMATAPPSPRRWSDSGNDLAPALAEPGVWQVAVELGYEAKDELWI
jgi:hypothetical protein